MSGAVLQQRPHGPVIRADELGLWTQSASLLAAAQAEAAAILDQAAAAHRAEQERGYKEGVDAAAADIATRLAELTAREGATLAEIEATLPDLVGAILDRILGEGDRTLMLQQAVRTALAQRSWKGAATLRIAPVDEPAVRAALADDPRLAAIAVEAFANQPQGTCVFDCDHGSIELGIEAQLRAIRDGIAKGWAEAPP